MNGTLTSPSDASVGAMMRSCTNTCAACVARAGNSRRFWTAARSDAVTLPSAAVGEALRQVVRAASTDDARAVLTGVLISAEDDGVRMVATDSYRLAVRELPENEMLTGGQKVLVPSRALNR